MQRQQIDNSSSSSAAASWTENSQHPLLLLQQQRNQQQQQPAVLSSSFLGRIAAMEAAAAAAAATSSSAGTYDDDEDDDGFGYAEIPQPPPPKFVAVKKTAPPARQVDDEARKSQQRPLGRRLARLLLPTALFRRSASCSATQRRPAVDEVYANGDYEYTRWSFFRRAESHERERAETRRHNQSQCQLPMELRQQRQLQQQQQQQQQRLMKSASSRTVRFQCPYEGVEHLKLDGEMMETAAGCSTGYTIGLHQLRSQQQQQQQQQQRQQPSVSSGYGSDVETTGGCGSTEHHLQWAVREEDIDKLLGGSGCSTAGMSSWPPQPSLPRLGDADDLDVSTLDLTAIFSSDDGGGRSGQFADDDLWQIDQIVRDVVRLKAETIDRQRQQQQPSKPAAHSCCPPSRPQQQWLHQRHASASPMLPNRRQQQQPQGSGDVAAPCTGGSIASIAVGNDWNRLKLAQFH